MKTTTPKKLLRIPFHTKKFVNGLQEATAFVAPPSPPQLKGILLLLKKFWIWNLPLVITITVLYYLSYFLFSGRTRSITMDSLLPSFMTVTANSNNPIYNSIIMLLQIVRFFVWSILKFIFATMLLLLCRICQRLSWYTTEFGTHSNVKEIPTYQDEELLNKAWAQGHQTCGWEDPTTAKTCDDNKRSPQIIFQPRPGFCGISSFNSALRTFYCNTKNNATTTTTTTTTTTPTIEDPYIQLHSLPRYVTLEEAQKFFQHILDHAIWSRKNQQEQDEQKVNDKHTPQKPILTSCEVIGGGSHGIRSYEAFVHALKQIHHPTQPARILAMYSRTPLFFCYQDGVRGTFQKIFNFPAAHWSPVISYLEKEDLVLVMDVNHTYGERGYLLSSRRLYDAVNTKCIMTGKYRGLIALRGPPAPATTTASPLLLERTELSCAFGKLKEAYYHHIATNGKSEEDANHYPNTENNDFVRLITFSDNDKEQKMEEKNNKGNWKKRSNAVVSKHPMTFTNTCFLPTTNDGAVHYCEGDKLFKHDIQNLMNVFKELQVPMVVPIYGCNDFQTFQSLHQDLLSLGLAPTGIQPRSMYLNLLPSITTNNSVDSSTSTVTKEVLKLPEGFELQELITVAPASSNSGDDSNGSVASNLIYQWGNVVSESYGFLNVQRNGMSPGEFLGHAFQKVTFGNNLRTFICIDKRSQGKEDHEKKVVGCSTLYYNFDIQPKVAVMFNVCVLKEYRGCKLGKILSQCVINEARNVGCQQLLLEASNKGKPVYEKLGFITSCEKYGGVYIKLSTGTNDFKWKLVFQIIERLLSIKNKKIYKEELIKN